MNPVNLLLHPNLVLDRLLSPIERAFLRKAHEPEAPQFFIFGLPRSGTTLIYQYIVHRLDVAYFTNWVGWFARSPCVITFVQSRLQRSYRSDFKSDYGKVRGPMAPREAGNVWPRFFSLDGYVKTEMMTPNRIRELQQTVWRVQNLFRDAPFVNKNVKHLLRIPALADAFPRCRFIVVHRDPVQIALSILKARQTIAASLPWWSVRPRSYTSLLNRPRVEQVAGQVCDLSRDMEKDLGRLDPCRVIRVDYAAFCKNPEGVITAIRNQVPSIGMRNRPVSGFIPHRKSPRDAMERQLEVLIREQFHP